MSADEIFRWHPRARVLGCDATALACPARHAKTGGWQSIPSGSAALVLPQVFAAVESGQGFCVLPPGASGRRAPAPPPFAGRGAAFATLSGGSTGAPKVILRRPASWTASFEVNRALFDLGPASPAAIFGALGHSLALYAALESLHLGADLHDLARVSPSRQAEALRQGGVAVAYITPAQLRLLLRAAPAPLPRLRLLLIGGATLDPATRAGARRLAPNAALRQFYGTSETSFIAMDDADEDRAAGDVGPPYPGVSVTIHAPSGHPLPPCEIGEIRVRSPYLFERYADDRDGAACSDGWSTGEIGRLDAAGRLHLLGRRDRMLSIADQNVWPEAVESVLLSAPGVAQAAVLALPDALRGARLVAFVAGAGAEHDAAALQRRCRAELGRAATPHRLWALDDWPMLPSGKTDYAALARLAESRAT